MALVQQAAGTAIKAGLGWLGGMLVQRLSHYPVLRNFKNRRGMGGLSGPCQYVDGPQKFLAGAPDVAFQLQIARVAAGDQTAAGQP